MALRGTDGDPSTGERVIFTSLLAAAARERDWVDLTELCESASRVVGMRAAREQTLSALAHHVANRAVACQVARRPASAPVPQFGLRFPGVRPDRDAARISYAGDGTWMAEAQGFRISGLGCLEDATEAAADLLGHVGR